MIYYIFPFNCKKRCAGGYAFLSQRNYCKLLNCYSDHFMTDTIMISFLNIINLA